MAFLPLPADSRGRSMSAPSLVPPPGPGPKWLSSVLPTPPDSDTNEDEAAPIRKRPVRQFAAFDLGFIPLTSTEEPPKIQLCYEELEEEPQLPPTPRITLKDGRELRPLLKHRKRSASHNVPDSVRWGASLTRSPSSVSVGSPPSENLDDDKPASEGKHEPEHPHEHSHVHFSEALENVCVFDETAPAHDADPTHSPLPEKQCLQPPPSSPRTRSCRQLRLPGTVIASPTHKAKLGFDSSEPDSPVIPSLAPLSPRGDMRLALASDAALPSPQNAPRHGMFTTLGMRISPSQNALTGVVRVRNVGFEKRVWALYSVDNWQTQREAEGTWTDAYREGEGDIPARPDGYDDFEIGLPLVELGIQGSAGTAVRARVLHFAIGYRVTDKGEWWDNRDGANWVARFRAVCPGSQFD